MSSLFYSDKMYYSKFTALYRAVFLYTLPCNVSFDWKGNYFSVCRTWSPVVAAVTLQVLWVHSPASDSGSPSLGWVCWPGSLLPGNGSQQLQDLGNEPQGDSSQAGSAPGAPRLWMESTELISGAQPPPEQCSSCGNQQAVEVLTAGCKKQGVCTRKLLIYLWKISLG